MYSRIGGKEDRNGASNLAPNHSREEQGCCLPAVLLGAGRLDHVSEQYF